MLKFKKVYITGDSHIQKEDQKYIRDVDCLVYSLLDFDVVKGQLDKRLGKYQHIIEIIDIQKWLTPNDRNF